MNRNESSNGLDFPGRQCTKSTYDPDSSSLLHFFEFFEWIQEESVFKKLQRKSIECNRKNAHFIEKLFLMKK